MSVVGRQQRAEIPRFTSGGRAKLKRKDVGGQSQVEWPQQGGRETSKAGRRCGWPVMDYTRHPGGQRIKGGLGGSSGKRVGDLNEATAQPGAAADARGSPGLYQRSGAGAAELNR
jgi:hypothetical protein